jgi:hypothetical protein
MSYMGTSVHSEIILRGNSWLCVVEQLMFSVRSDPKLLWIGYSLFLYIDENVFRQVVNCPYVCEQ